MALMVLPWLEPSIGLSILECQLGALIYVMLCKHADMGQQAALRSHHLQGQVAAIAAAARADVRAGAVGNAAHATGDDDYHGFLRQCKCMVMTASMTASNGQLELPCL